MDMPQKLVAIQVGDLSLRPTINDVLPVVRAIYARHCAGCCLHLMVDDGNVDQSSADVVLQYAREQGHSDCIAVATVMAAMSTTQRKQVYVRSHRRLSSTTREG